MSYTGRVSGYLSVDPPLKWSQIKDSRFYVENKVVTRGTPSAVLHVDREDVETDTGVNTVLTCRVVGPFRDSPYDARSMEEDVVELVKEFTGHTFRGELVVDGDDFGGDIWRVVCDEDGVRKEQAQLLWPDGSKVEL